MKGKIPLFLRLTLVVILTLTFLLLPTAASVATPAQLPVLDEGVVVGIASTDYGVVPTSLVALNAAIDGQQVLTITAAPAALAFTEGQTVTTLTATTRAQHGFTGFEVAIFGFTIVPGAFGRIRFFRRRFTITEKDGRTERQPDTGKTDGATQRTTQHR